MFTDEEINAYRNITAPDGLYKKIILRQKRPQKVLYMIAAVAACFILVISTVLVNAQNSIIINGQKLRDSVEFYVSTLSLERTVSSAISVPIEVKTSDKTKISVDEGIIRTEGISPSKEIEIASSAVLWWEIEPDKENGEFKMTISSKKGVQKVSLKYENAKIKVTKE